MMECVEACSPSGEWLGSRPVGGHLRGDLILALRDGEPTVARACGGTCAAPEWWEWVEGPIPPGLRLVESWGHIVGLTADGVLCLWRGGIDLAGEAREPDVSARLTPEEVEALRRDPGRVWLVPGDSEGSRGAYEAAWTSADGDPGTQIEAIGIGERRLDVFRFSVVFDGASWEAWGLDEPWSDRWGA